MSSESRPAPQRILRPVTEDEVPAFFDQMDFGFHEQTKDDERVFWRGLVGDLERTVALWEDGELVGTGGAFDFEMTVPGGAAVPVGGVTMITVKATHRRRGVLTAMLKHQLDGWHESGRYPVAILTASEPGIYGRFGYGIGCHGYSLSIPRGDNGLSRVPGIDKYRIRMVDAEASYERCQEIFDHNRLARSGMLNRPPHWRAQAVEDADWRRTSSGPLRVAVAEGPDGTVEAYARYRVKEDYSIPGRPSCVVRTSDVYGTETAAEMAIWRFLLDLDLTSEVTATVPTDAPLLNLVDDWRAAQPRVNDQTYVRLIDLDKALVARRYAAPVDVVLEVSDTFCPWNAGRWRLTVGADGTATCTRTSDPADLATGVRELGSAYLGGIRLAALGAAGRVTELTPGTLAAVSRAFAEDIAPWLPFGF